MPSGVPSVPLTARYPQSVVDTIPGAGKTREAFPIRFTCDVPPDEGGPPAHKHTGQTYVVTPPKTALSFKLAVQTKQAQDDPGKLVDGLDLWMDKAFGRDIAGQLRARIYGEPQDADTEPVDDDDDPLDITDVMAVMQHVTERATSLPPT